MNEGGVEAWLGQRGISCCRPMIGCVIVAQSPTSSSFCSAFTVVAASGSQATRNGMNATLHADPGDGLDAILRLMHPGPSD